MQKSTQFYFHKVDKIAFESSYKTLKLWEMHDCIFTTVFKICEAGGNFIPWIKSGYSKLHNFEIHSIENKNPTKINTLKNQ